MRALALCCTVATLALACSNTPEGTGGTGADGGSTGGGKTGCTGAFCLDDDQKPGVTPSQITFAPQSPGTTAETTLKVSNLGARGTLQLKAMGFDPVNPEFSVDFKPQALAPQTSVEFKVRYSPASTSATATTLHIDSNAVDAALQRVSVPIKVSGASNGLQFNPNPCHFGNVAKGGADKTISLINTATLPLQIKTMNLAPMGSLDFTIVGQPDLSKPIEPGGSMPVTLHYAPKGGDNDTTTLQVETATGVKGSVLVTGQEIAPDIVLIPPKVNFGAVALTGDFTQVVKVKNQGLAPLKVASIAVFPPTMASQIEVTGAKPPFELAPDGSQVLQVVLHAKGQPMPNDGAPVAALKVASDDPGSPDVSVPLFAHSDLGILLVSPPDELAFGNVGKNVSSKKDVSLFNKGTAPLQVQSVAITDDAMSEFAIVAKPSLPADLAPNEQQFVTVAFTNKGPADTDATAVLHIKSQDSAKPDWAVKLVAHRMMSATCQVVVSPQPLNFGLLPYGMSKSLPVTLTNKGTGYCQFEQAMAYDCYEAPTIQFPGQQPAPKCKGSKSPYYTVGAPSTKLFNLGPNDSGQLIVHFEAPETLGDGLFSQGKAAKTTDVPGLLLVSFTNQADGSQVKVPVGFSTTQADKSAPTLWAKVGKADVKVMPSDIDFGIVSVGCKAPLETATVYNTGTTNVYVTKVELQNCGPEVDAVNWPAIPKTGLSVTTNKPLAFSVKYGPQNVGKDTCALVVYTDMAGTCALQNGSGGSGKSCTGDSTPIDCAAGEYCKGTQFTVPLVGEGTLDTEWTDEFIQGTGKKVDVLFVVDDSGSMDNKQSQLAGNFAQFVQIATLWNNDYHIGVVTTDMADSNKSGKLQQANGVRIVTPADKNAQQDLLKLTKPGSGGSGDEQGLAAAEAALTAPLVSSTTTACQTDADCKSVGGSCVTGADDGKKFCGGHNRTFLRKNASLEVVVVSDEEDSSASDVNYYANLFYSLHGAGNKNLFHFHAITGDPGKGCQNNGGADAGNRYYDLVQKTGGKWGSICANDYAQFLKDIGNAAFGLAEQYFLTRTPEPSTIEVKVNGKPCAVGPKTWSYDAVSNSVSFVPQAQGGQCMPQEGQKISIHYKMLCFP